MLGNLTMFDMWEHPPTVRFGGQAMVEVAGVLYMSSEIADLLLSGACGLLDDGLLSSATSEASGEITW